MTTEIPRIQPIEKAFILYRGYQDVNRVIKPKSYDNSRIILASELSGLDGLLTNADTYLTLANSLSKMRYNLRDFHKSINENLEDVIKYVGANSYGSSGQSQGKVSGDVNLGVYDLKKLTNTVSSNHQWLKDFLTQYVAEINRALESVEDGEPDAQLKVEIDRMNNAMTDCYKEKNLIKLKFASQNLLGGLKCVREMMFPTNSYYPQVDNFAKEVVKYVDSLRALREFGEGKESVSFRVDDSPPEVEKFEDKSPRPKGKGFLANLLS